MTCSPLELLSGGGLLILGLLLLALLIGNIIAAFKFFNAKTLGIEVRERGGDSDGEASGGGINWPFLFAGAMVIAVLALFALYIFG